MTRTKKLIIAILLVILIGLIAVIVGNLYSGPDLTNDNKTILVLASDKYEQSNGGVDMAFLVRLENGSLKNYTPVYWRNDTPFTARTRRTWWKDVYARLSLGRIRCWYGIC